jgi:hypothetical protein
MSDLQSNQPRLIKITNPISNINRADVKALENAKTGKVTAVVAVMHLYGNAKSSSIKAKAKISAKNTKQSCKASLLLEYHIFFLAQASQPLKQPRPTRLM